MAMIDLRSDTVTRPCPVMRDAMAQAEVGDDVYGEDPTVNHLQEYAAALLGKEAALLAPSGTMANLLAVLTQTRPGDSIILHESAHPVRYEGANIALVAGVLPAPAEGPQGKLTRQDVETRIVQQDDPHLSHTTLVAIENTTNRGGGAYYSEAEISDIAGLCRNRGLRLHMDGARLFNAAIATETPAAALAAPCDTVSVCLSKGLGAPAGSLLAGTAETVHKALRYRKMLGGGMRQVGVLAAAGLHALEHHVQDLREDHRRAGVFRKELEAEGVRFPLPSPTNIVYVDVPGPAENIVGHLAEAGVQVLAVAEHRLRVVFHRDIDDPALAAAIDAFKRVLTR